MAEKTTTLTEETQKLLDAIDDGPNDQPIYLLDDEEDAEVVEQLRKLDKVIPGSMESLLGLTYKAGAKEGTPKTYEVYLEIRRLIDSGLSINATSKKLRLPYSSCHVYANLPPERVEELKFRSENPHLKLTRKRKRRNMENTE
ncbi:MAG: hypothetical protein LBF58_02305 [Deltaproteobacteria bacterium]|jgi:hypothetical protein|nr:hypothetical protein [Deltaproteobacteria bacterium]